MRDLLEMSESRAEEVDRISCEEEERVSKGFDIETYFSIDGSMDRIRQATAKVGANLCSIFDTYPRLVLYTSTANGDSKITKAFPLD